MTNAERYYSVELREIEQETMNAEETAVAREQDLFIDLVNKTLEYANELLAVAKLSKPLTKDFTKETLLRVKLDF